MPDDKSKRGNPDRQRINVNEPYELAYWTKKLGVTEEDLKRHVRKAGPMAKDVERSIASERLIRKVIMREK